jgi:hypothetical protein
MAKRELSSLSVSEMSLVELIQLSGDTVKKVKDFIKLNSKDVLLTTQCQKTEQSQQALEAAQASLQPTGLSGRLEKADLARDQAFRTVTSFVKAHALISTEAVQRAYQQVLPLIQSHRETVSRSYEIQSQQTRKFLQEIKSPAYQQAIAQLNLQTHITALEAAQTHFEQIYKERVNEQATLTPGRLKARRKDLEINYRHLVGVIYLSANIYDQPNRYEDLLNMINALRTRYRKPRRKKGEDKPDGTT